MTMTVPEVIAMLLSFITALAWMWGAIGAVCSALIVLGFVAKDLSNAERIGVRVLLWGFIVSGVPCWSWIVARYLR